MQLRGKSALVTGAASSIGAESPARTLSDGAIKQKAMLRGSAIAPRLASYWIPGVVGVPEM